MTTVKGSKQYRYIVVRHQPGRRLVAVLVVAAMLVLVAQISFKWGGSDVAAGYDSVVVDRDRLAEELLADRAALQEASQQLANISLGAEVDRQAVDGIRQVVKEQKQTIAELTEEITFYKGLMAPTDKEKGLSIRGWELYPTNNPRRYQFKLVVQQLAVKHALLKGSVTVDVVGRRGGLEETLSWDILSDDVASRQVKLRFKYFQNIEGDINIPVGFEPQRIDLVAKATSPKTAQVEKHYGWIVHGG